MRIIPLFAMVMISGCATLSPQECQTANWKQIGEKDGQAGRPNRLAQHYKACSKVNIVPNQSLYESGYRQGQKYYCQPHVIYEYALKGSGGYRVCPVDQQADLRPFYDIPNDYYQAKNKRDSVLKELDKYQDYLLDKKLTQEKRNFYINKIRELKSEKSRVEDDYDDALRRLNRFERQNNL
ncbi:DUF2799 domain-containing protein [Acinetobacter shaoyimingii]|uniref:DUF2799 domain-containing protein n=1 Tax=Acinetobacter shaoyimingii TaxID=2715164 RepID=A0A6G8RWJ7_9GAMM|nr:DUF2799 domain-containing protein [Acinetobacter shaoyimingii]QIO06220.1 DUF2799 domain-containing protein [Acinetobacter shaoyimingii]